MIRPPFPKHKDILIVDDFPTQQEIQQDIPFSSTSHTDFLEMLRKFSKIKLTNVGYTYFNFNKPDPEDAEYVKSIISVNEYKKTTHEGYILLENLQIYISPEFHIDLQKFYKYIEKVSPKIIIPIGKWSFLFLSGFFDIKKTRGTKIVKRRYGGIEMYRASEIAKENYLLFPMYPTTMKFYYPKKVILYHWDFKKLGSIYRKIIENTYNPPKSNYIINPSLEDITKYLDKLEKLLQFKVVPCAVDIETLRNTIDTIGLCYKESEAISICFGDLTNYHYYTSEEEANIIYRLCKVFSHHNFKLIGQNWGYDVQFLRKYWLYFSKVSYDTMIIQHCLYNFLPKDLATLASIYVPYYSNWKGKVDFNEGENK